MLFLHGVPATTLSATRHSYHYRVSLVCIFPCPACDFAVPVFCNPARDMSNTNFSPLLYVRHMLRTRCMMRRWICGGYAI